MKKIIIGEPITISFASKKRDKFFGLNEELFEYQKEGIDFIDSDRGPFTKKGYAIIGDEPGLGKTMIAIGSSYLHVSEGSFLIVTTATMKLKWQREIKKWTSKTAFVINGTKVEPLPDKKYYIINYNILGTENEVDKLSEKKRKEAYKKEIEKEKILYEKKQIENEKKFLHLEEKRKASCKSRGVAFNPFVFIKRKYKPKKFVKNEVRLEGWILELAKKNIIGIYVDEAHRLSNPDSIQTRCFKKLLTELNPKLFVPLTGTLKRNKTKDMFPILNMVAPDLFPNKYKFQWEYCDPKRTAFGWDFNGSSNEEQLHKLLKKIMIRRLKKDENVQKVINVLPKIFSVIPLEPSSDGIKNYLKAHKDFSENLQNMSTQLEKRNSLSVLKRFAYLAKREQVFNWIDEYLETHDKLIIAVWHRMVIDDFMEKYKDCILKIDGSVTGKKRQIAEDRFQTDDSIKLICLQIEAGGEGITLTASSAVAIIECPDTPRQLIQVSDRPHRVGQKEQVIIYYLFADGTVENRVANKIEESYKSFSNILDGEKTNGLFNYTFDDEILKSFD